MYCQFCGKELSEGAASCRACGKAVPEHAGSIPPTPPRGTASDTVDALLEETKRAAQSLAAVSARFSERLLAKADAVAKRPGASAKSAAHKAAEELDRARREIERALERL